MRFAFDVFYGDDWAVPIEQTGYVFDDYDNACWAAVARLEALWAAGARVIGTTVVSNDADHTTSGDPSVEEDITPATLGWLPR